MNGTHSDSEAMVTTTTPLIELGAVDKSFDGETAVLDGIDLELARGDFAALIGPSGCGKSTLLKLIAGLLSHTGGTIEVGGGSPEQASGKLGYVFQDANLLPWMNILENVALPLKLSGQSSELRYAKAREMLSMVGLTAAAQKYPRELSGGMKMRVSIARALATQPEILLLDEPFGALDEMSRNGLNEELLRLRESQGWTGVFVTHSVSEAVFLSNKVIVLSANPGRVHAQMEIDLPFPRTAQTRGEEAFQKQVARVSRSLHAVHD